MRKRLFSVVLAMAALGLVAAACRKHADPARNTAMICGRVYRVCPNVVPANPSEATLCAEAFQGPCGAELRQHVQCTMGKCDDAGAVDRLEVERVCLATLEAYRACEEEDDGGAGRDGGIDQGQLPPFPASRADAGDAGARD